MIQPQPLRVSLPPVRCLPTSINHFAFVTEPTLPKIAGVADIKSRNAGWFRAGIILSGARNGISVLLGVELGLSEIFR
jgi:hypothetical protein